MNPEDDTGSRWVLSGRIAIVAIAVAVVALVVATIAVDDEWSRTWLVTFTATGLLVIAVLGSVRVYRRRGRVRSAILHRRFAGAVVVGSVVTPAFRRDAAAVAKLLGTNVGGLLLGASFSIVVGSDGMTAFTGSREPIAVLSIPAAAIERVERATAFGLDGTPVPGVQFTVEHAQERAVLNAYVRPAVARLAVDGMRELLG